MISRFGAHEKARKELNRFVAIFHGETCEHENPNEVI
jgi:hypothetical protein